MSDADLGMLAPPEAPLVVPAAGKAIAPEQAVGKVPIAPADAAKLDGQVDAFVSDLLAAPVLSDAFKARIDAINSMGSTEIVRSANVSNRLLDKPMKALKDGALGESSPVSKSLLDLRRTVESLDPSKRGDLLSVKKILGFVPMGNKLVDYFRSYESAQSHLNGVIESLYRSKDELLRDNAAIETEKAAMWALMQTLEKYGLLAKKIAEGVGAQIATVETSDPERARVLKEDVLFYARQKQQDIATQMAVNVQGYLALDIIKKTNVELMKGVDRATTTTVAALRTAVITAQALTSQKLVLDQISALNSTTSNLIESTSKMLRTNAERTFEQASSATIDLEKLKNAFANVQGAIDSMSSYRVKALDSMEQTVDALTGEVDKAKAFIAARSLAPASEPPTALPQ